MAKTTTAVALEATTAGEGPACVGRGKFVNYFGLLIAPFLYSVSPDNKVP